MSLKEQRRSMFWGKAEALCGSEFANLRTSVLDILRPGLLLGRLDTGSECEEWDADASDVLAT